MGRAKKQPENKDYEFDLHVWVKPETEDMAALFTVSVGRRAICIDMPLMDALRCIEGELQSEEYL